MKSKKLLFQILLFTATVAFAGSLPPADQRAAAVRDFNTPRTFPAIHSRGEWQARAREIREHTLVSCGLWPLPEKTPLQAKIFDRVERDGYSVEKVYLQTYPGFYLAGNLYRPLGQGKGPFPAVLNPHGHGKLGRLTDDEMFSNPARCIQFARLGLVAFAYDMAGYNDTMQLGEHKKFLLPPQLQLWSISLMGLQTWNSIRALDFLESLPDVDKRRLACTGESGGGTQTFMLGAVDGRLAAQVPVVMVSSIMQGGCQCENAPGLRVDYSNMEIAAAPAPRPQLLVAATGDWTKLTPTVEGPALAGVYQLLGVRDRLHFVQFDFKHNYNRTSREAVYPWLDHWLRGQKYPAEVKEQPYTKEPDAALRVWPDGKLPSDALHEEQFITFLKQNAQAQLAKFQPRDGGSLAEYKRAFEPVWRHSLQLESPANVLLEKGEVKDFFTCTRTALAFGRPSKGDRVPAFLFTPAADKKSSLVILVHPAGKSASLDVLGRPAGLARMLVERGHPVLLLDSFLTGELADSEAATKRKYFEKFFTTYNRTDVQERVQDLVTACALAKQQLGARRVILCGAGHAGLWSLLAAPSADAVVADVNALDLGTDAPLLEQDLFAPGLRKFGAFQGAALLAAPHPIFLHNMGKTFPMEELRQTYTVLKADRAFRPESARLGDTALVDWITVTAAR